jgi:hypothetical protein
MKDFLGRTLEVGDNVIFITPNYRDYTTGTIVAFTAKNVRVEFKCSYRVNSTELILQAPSQLIKYEK